MLASSLTAAWVGCNALIDNESATYAPFSDGGPDGGAGMDATLVMDGSSVDGSGSRTDAGASDVAVDSCVGQACAACQPLPTSTVCASMACGTTKDNCDADVTCPNTCSPPGLCGAGGAGANSCCVPDCAGMACGTEHCGLTTCGTCDAGAACLTVNTGGDRCVVGSCYVAGTACYYPVNQPLNVQCCFPFLCSDAGGGLTTCQ
jgi:hypothetical protein